MQKLYFWGLGMLTIILAITTTTIAAPQSHDGYRPFANFFQRLRQSREQSTEINSADSITSKPSDEITQSPLTSTSSSTQLPASSSTAPTSTTPGNIYLTTKPPHSTDVDRINNGVTTILNGVMSLDLAQILRGAFIFPKSQKVKSVANNVIDTIFGPAPVPLNGTSSGNINNSNARFQTRY